MHNKIVNNISTETNICCERKVISSILKEVLPPVRADDFESEVEHILSRFHGRKCIEERKFTAEILLENHIWEVAGETVVKEMVYLDGICSLESNNPLLSSGCLDKLEVENII